MILSLMFHRILTTMFVNHYVCSFEILVKILDIRLFISTIVILAFNIIVVVNRSLDRFIWENIILMIMIPV